MDSTKRFEWDRQLFHIILGSAIVALIVSNILDKFLMLVIIISGIIISYLSTRGNIPIISYFLNRLERPNDRQRFPGKGMLFYFIGCYLSMVFFERDIALASMMVLALGDSVSHLYGITYGRIRHPLSDSKFLEGTIVGFIAGFLGALIFLSWQEAAIASLSGMFVEVVEIKFLNRKFDDNFLIPVASGFAVFIMRLIKYVI